MTAALIDGAALAARIRKQVAADVAGLPTPPGLATVLVGDDPASAIYVSRKRKCCAEAGMRDVHRHLPVNWSMANESRSLVGWDEVQADLTRGPVSHCAAR
jgi:methylenetetrahydrofolate dehydrogenase (NADP+) / methenyltetrahydrofolate cyclohydrolase